MEYNRLLMHTKRLLEIMEVNNLDDLFTYEIAKKEIEEDERAETEGGTTGCEAHSTNKITWGDVYEGRVKLPKIPKK